MKKNEKILKKACKICHGLYTWECIEEFFSSYNILVLRQCIFYKFALYFFKKLSRKSWSVTSPAFFIFWLFFFGPDYSGGLFLPAGEGGYIDNWPTER